MRTREDLAWAAGLFEGEGSFSYSKHTGGTGRQVQARAELAMTDEDVVRRFHQIIGIGAVDSKHTPSMQAAGHKPQWRWRVWSYEQIQAVVAMFWPWLGQRRRGRAKEVLGVVNASTVPYRERYPVGACRRGHEWSDTNTAIRANGSRRCRMCRRVSKSLDHFQVTAATKGT